MNHKLDQSSELVVGSKNSTNYELITNNQLGQSLMEVIIAMAVGILVVVALVFATIFSLRNAAFAKTSAQATKLAQEGIEKMKAIRDRNTQIRGSFTINSAQVTHWQDTDLWNNRIDGNCGNNSLIPPTYCYFKINSSGELEHLTAAASIPSTAESIGQFQRVVILSDDADYQTQKKVSVIVKWTDFAGSHESKLTTILRKL